MYICLCHLKKSLIPENFNLQVEEFFIQSIYNDPNSLVGVFTKGSTYFTFLYQAIHLEGRNQTKTDRQTDSLLTSHFHT